MRRFAVLIFALTGMLPPAWAQGTITPEPLSENVLTEVPYLYNGRMSVIGAVGSGSMVAKGVVVTAAHVIYDEETFQWIPISQVRYNPRYHKGATAPPGSQVFTPTASLRWTSYDTRKENDDSGPGLSSPDTFNIDFAVVYFSSGITDPTIDPHAEVNIDVEGEVGILRDNRDKMHVGYPTEFPQIPSGESGYMHRTAPANYESFWGGLEGLEERDSENFWIAMYDFDGVTTYGGSSGGPLYVKDDLGNWLMSGIVVGSNGSDGMLVRGIDEGAWEWIEQAIIVRGKETVMRVDNLSILNSGRDFVELDWSDHSSGESGYTVLRSETGVWEAIASLPADSTTYMDNDVLTGNVYSYRVQPYGADGGRPPKSNIATATTLGNSPDAASFLAQPWLQFSSVGDSNWHFDGSSRLRSGVVRSNGLSSLKLDIIGPGTISFDWSVSSEVNLDYENPESPNQGEIYDAIYLYLDGSPVENEGVPVFLSGILPSENQQLVLSEGPHVVEWRYVKDPYATEGEDAGFLHNLSWTPDPVAPYPVFGGYAFAGTPYHGSEWFGVYYADSWPWVVHLELGWMYFSGTPDGQLYGYAAHPVLGNFYTTPAMFPFLFLSDTSTWIFYYEGTGLWGKDAWFWNANTGEYIQTP